MVKEGAGDIDPDHLGRAVFSQGHGFRAATATNVKDPLTGDVAQDGSLSRPLQETIKGVQTLPRELVVAGQAVPCVSHVPHGSNGPLAEPARRLGHSEHRKRTGQRGIASIGNGPQASR